MAIVLVIDELLLRESQNDENDTRKGLRNMSSTEVTSSKIKAASMMSEAQLSK